MVFLNQQAILGAIIPDVRISKITLESGGDTLIEREPHINHEREAGLVADARGNLTRAVVLPSFKDASETGQPLRITVDLVIKEKLDNSLVGSWFTNQDFSQYLQLKIFQSTRQDVTQAATNNKRFFEVADHTRGRTILTQASDAEAKAILPSIDVPLGTNLRSILQNSLTIKVLSMKDDHLGDKDNLNKHYTEIDSDGNRITTLTYRVDFQLPNENPNHLAYFAFSYINLLQLAQDFSLNFDSVSNFRDPIGVVTSDIVFRDGSIVDESFIFTDPTGRIWTGPITRSSGGEFFGVTNAQQDISEATRLVRRTIQNSKVQDFRNFHELESLSLDFSFVENEIIRRKVLNLARDPLDFIAPKMFFSRMYLARDDEDNARFFFSVNYKRIMEETSIYGKFFQRTVSFPDIVQKSAITSMKVFRHRVGGSPEVGSAPRENEKFDDDQIDEVFVVSGEKIFKNFVTINNDKGSLKEIERLHTPNQNLMGIRHFTGVDKEMPLITDGYYKYGVEFEIQDPALAYLIERLNVLRSARANFEKYYQEASSIGTISKQIAFTDPHIDFAGEKVEFNEAKQGNFDPVLNRFTQEFIENQRQRFLNAQTIVTPWGAAVLIYLQTLRLFTDEQDLRFDELLPKLLHFVHPATGNLRGIQKLIDLMQALENSINVALGIDQGSTNISGVPEDGSPLESTVAMGTKAKKTISVKFLFSEIYDSSVDNATGYDFLDIAGEQDKLDGLKFITGEEYNTRVEKETDKYFNRLNQINPDISLNFGDQAFTENDTIDITSYSYLTPSKYKVRDRFEITRLGESPTPKNVKEKLATADICTRNRNSRSTISQRPGTNNASNLSTGVQTLRAETLQLFADLCIVPVVFAAPARLPLGDAILPQADVQRTPDPVDPIIDVRSACEVDIEKVNNTNYVPLMLDLARRTTIDKVSPTVASKLKKGAFASNQNAASRRVNIQNFDVLNENSLINRLIENPGSFSAEAFFQGAAHTTTLNTALKALPNQVKSLFLARTNPDVIKTNWFENPTDPILTNDDEAEFRLSYRMINVIQIFNGYDEDEEGNPLVNSPRWEPLTLQLFNEATGQALLCRLHSYENKLIGIKREEALELPIFDEYFILRPQRDAEPSEESPSIPQETITAFNTEEAIQMNVRSEFITTNIIGEENTRKLRGGFKAV